MFKDYSDSRGGLSPRNFELTIGIVTDISPPSGEDIKGDYRVRVKFPFYPSSQGAEAKGTAENTDQSVWARIVTFGAGKDGTGAFFLPEVDSEVLVGFIAGDFNHPVVLGTLWNGQDKPAYSNTDAKSDTKRYQNNDAKFRLKAEAKKNDIRSISTRAKHELVFNDNASEPGVVLSSGQKHRIVLNDKGNEPMQIEIYDGKEENYILIDTKNKKITLESKTGDILIKAKEKIRLEAKIIETKSDKDTAMDVGANFKMEAKSNMTLKASGQGEVNSSATLTVKGSTVNIN